MERAYNLHDHKIKVTLEPQLVRVYSDKPLWTFLKADLSSRFETLAKTIKDDYLGIFGKELQISNDSLIVEILVHVYCDYLGLYFNKVVRIKFIQTIVKKLLERAEVVDCGERSVDSNRWVWDALARFKRPLIKFLPKDLNAKQLKQ